MDTYKPLLLGVLSALSYCGLFFLVPAEPLALHANLFGLLVLIPYVGLIYAWLVFNFFMTSQQGTGTLLLASCAGAVFGTGAYFVLLGIIGVGITKIIFAGFLLFVLQRDYSHVR